MFTRFISHAPVQIVIYTSFNTLSLRQNCWHFVDNIFKCIFLNENTALCRYLPETLCAWASHRNCAKTPTMNTTSPVSFLSNSHKRYPISRLLGHNVRCLLWEQTLIYVLIDPLQCGMKYLVKMDLVIMAPDCIRILINILLKFVTKGRINIFLHKFK